MYRPSEVIILSDDEDLSTHGRQIRSREQSSLFSKGHNIGNAPASIDIDTSSVSGLHRSFAPHTHPQQHDVSPRYYQQQEQYQEQQEQAYNSQSQYQQSQNNKRFCEDGKQQGVDREISNPKRFVNNSHHSSGHTGDSTNGMRPLKQVPGWNIFDKNSPFHMGTNLQNIGAPDGSVVNVDSSGGSHGINSGGSYGHNNPRSRTPTLNTPRKEPNEGDRQQSLNPALSAKTPTETMREAQYLRARTFSLGREATISSTPNQNAGRKNDASGGEPSPKLLIASPSAPSKRAGVDQQQNQETPTKTTIQPPVHLGRSASSHIALSGTEMEVPTTSRLRYPPYSSDSEPESIARSLRGPSAPLPHTSQTVTTTAPTTSPLPHTVAPTRVSNMNYSQQAHDFHTAPPPHHHQHHHHHHRHLNSPIPIAMPPRSFSSSSSSVSLEDKFFSFGESLRLGPRRPNCEDSISLLQQPPTAPRSEREDSAQYLRSVSRHSEEEQQDVYVRHPYAKTPPLYHEQRKYPYEAMSPSEFEELQQQHPTPHPPQSLLWFQPQHVSRNVTLQQSNTSNNNSNNSSSATSNNIGQNYSSNVLLHSETSTPYSYHQHPPYHPTHPAQIDTYSSMEALPHSNYSPQEHTSSNNNMHSRVESPSSYLYHHAPHHHHNHQHHHTSQYSPYGMQTEPYPSGIESTPPSRLHSSRRTDGYIGRHNQQQELNLYNNNHHDHPHHPPHYPQYDQSSSLSPHHYNHLSRSGSLYYDPSYRSSPSVPLAHTSQVRTKHHYDINNLGSKDDTTIGSHPPISISGSNLSSPSHTYNHHHSLHHAHMGDISPTQVHANPTSNKKRSSESGKNSKVANEISLESTVAPNDSTESLSEVSAIPPRKVHGATQSTKQTKAKRGNKTGPKKRQDVIPKKVRQPSATTSSEPNSPSYTEEYLYKPRPTTRRTAKRAARFVESDSSNAKDLQDTDGGTISPKIITPKRPKKKTGTKPKSSSNSASQESNTNMQALQISPELESKKLKNVVIKSMEESKQMDVSSEAEGEVLDEDEEYKFYYEEHEMEDFCDEDIPTGDKSHNFIFNSKGIRILSNTATMVTQYLEHMHTELKKRKNIDILKGGQSGNITSSSTSTDSDDLTDSLDGSTLHELDMSRRRKNGKKSPKSLKRRRFEQDLYQDLNIGEFNNNSVLDLNIYNCVLYNDQGKKKRRTLNEKNSNENMNERNSKSSEHDSKSSSLKDHENTSTPATKSKINVKRRYIQNLLRNRSKLQNQTKKGIGLDAYEVLSSTDMTRIDDGVLLSEVKNQDDHPLSNAADAINYDSRPMKTEMTKPNMVINVDVSALNFNGSGLLYQHDAAIIELINSTKIAEKFAQISASMPRVGKNRPYKVNPFRISQMYTLGKGEVKKDLRFIQTYDRLPEDILNESLGIYPAIQVSNENQSANTETSDSSNTNTSISGTSNSSSVESNNISTNAGDEEENATNNKHTSNKNNQVNVRERNKKRRVKSIVKSDTDLLDQVKSDEEHNGEVKNMEERNRYDKKSKCNGKLENATFNICPETPLTTDCDNHSPSSSSASTVSKNEESVAEQNDNDIEKPDVNVRDINSIEEVQTKAEEKYEEERDSELKSTSVETTSEANHSEAEEVTEGPASENDDDEKPPENNFHVRITRNSSKRNPRKISNNNRRPPDVQREENEQSTKNKNANRKGKVSSNSKKLQTIRQADISAESLLQNRTYITRSSEKKMMMQIEQLAREEQKNKSDDGASSRKVYRRKHRHSDSPEPSSS